MGHLPSGKILMTQFSLEVVNIIMLPITIAVLHNGTVRMLPVGMAPCNFTRDTVHK